MQISVIASKTFCQNFSIALFHDGKVLHQRCLERNWNHVSQKRWGQNNESWLMWNPQISPSFNQKTIWLCFSLLQLLPPCPLTTHTSLLILSSSFSEWTGNSYFFTSWENEKHTIWSSYHQFQCIIFFADSIQLFVINSTNSYWGD